MSTASSTKPATGAPMDDCPFECNICFEVAREPVVTVCGHLYCWPCLFRWSRSLQRADACPVCKAGLDINKVIPIYCRDEGKRKEDGKEEPLPPRPQGQRPELVPRHNPLEYHFNTQPGILPTLFGINSGSQQSHMTPEQQHQAFLSRLLLLLGSFVILCLLMF